MLGLPLVVMLLVRLQGMPRLLLEIMLGLLLVLMLMVTLLVQLVLLGLLPVLDQALNMVNQLNLLLS